LLVMASGQTAGARASGRPAVVLHEHRDRGQVSVSISPRSTPRLLEVWLNGHRLDRYFTGVRLRRRTAKVGGDDGLRFGINVLRVTAARLGGRPVSRTLRFTIPRDRPLAGAGELRPVQAGSRVKLNGRSSQALSHGRLRYRWRIVTKPRESRARLIGGTDARPRLLTDRPGHYLVRLVLTELRGGGRGRYPVSMDDVDVAAQTPLPVSGAHVVVNAGHGAGDSVTVAGQSFAYGAAQTPVTAIVFDRQTLAFLGQITEPNTAAGGAAVTKMINAPSYPSQPMITSANQTIVILATDTGTGSKLDPSFAAAFSALGATYPDGGCGACTVIGIPGAFGAAYVNPSEVSAGSGSPEAANTHGYLQLDYSGTAYTFVPGQFVAFDTSVNASGQRPSQPGNVNTMRVGPNTFVSAPLSGCGAGGFQLVTVNSQTLALVANQTLTTNSCNAGNDSTAFGALETAISSRSQHNLLLLQGIGTPESQSPSFFTAVTITEIGRLLQQLGGTYGRFNSGAMTTGPGYAFVGNGSAEVEVSNSSPGNPPVRLTGLLQRDRSSYSWAPSGGPGALFSNATNPAATQLAPIAYQAPMAWPGAGEPGYESALQWISANVLGVSTYSPADSCYAPPDDKPDVRSSYCSNGIINGTIASKLQGTKYPSGQSFSSTTFSDVKKELLTVEFPEVQRVQDAVPALTGPLTDALSNISVPVASVQTAINTAIANGVKNSDPVGSGFDWSALGSIVAGFGWAVLPEFAGTVAGVVSEAFAAGGALVTADDGSPVLTPSLPGTTVNEYESEIQTDYQDAVSAFGRLEDMILSDPGRLKAFFNSGITGENAPTKAAETTAIDVAQAQLSWETLLPVAYQSDLLQFTANNTSSDPTKYTCKYATRLDIFSVIKSFAPYEQVSAAGQYEYSDPSTGQSVIAVLAGPGNPTDVPRPPQSAVSPIVPPQSLIGPLFQAPPSGYTGAAVNSADTGAALLGVDPAAFYEHDAIPGHQENVTCNYSAPATAARRRVPARRW
jgi:hypothetical protein